MATQHDAVVNELRATYETLTAMIDRANEKHDYIGWHVLSAARQIVHDALMEAEFGPD